VARVGDVVAARYELEELVGTGGMSSVFRAHDTLLERRVALKLLHEHVARDVEQVERFKREARSVAQLSHPNIVTVIDRGEGDGQQYIVFEYVDGENLKHLVVREGPLPVRQALEVALQVARALGFAHGQGLVHRDVKPQNVLLPPAGEAKVTDFGIARALDVDELTRSGSVVGTSHYIAPEQARGEPVDERTDVYSLGAVLFELLTGEVPFPGESFVAVAMRHVNEPAPGVAERRAGISPRLDAAVRRALAKDPAERFRSMDAFAEELAACLDELGPDTESDATVVVRAVTPATAPATAPQGSQPPHRRRRVVLPLSLAALAAAGAGVAFALVYYGLPGGSNRAATTARTTTTAPLRRVALRAVSTFDPPPGDGHENDGEVGNATDGNTATFWSTEGYDDGLAAIGKKGVGLVLAAPAGASVREVRVVSDTPGFKAQIRTGASESGDFAPATPARVFGSDTSLRLEKPSSARFLLLWITELAHPDKFRVHVNEISARG
jgi:serine/threonine-protein kinase